MGSGGWEQEYSRSPVTVMARLAGPNTSPGRAPGKDPYSWSSIPEHEDGNQRTISKLNRILPRACKVMEVKDKFNSETSSRNTHPPVTVMARLLA